MERLARALTALGAEAQVLEGFSDRRWRGLMASGGIGRGRARIGSMLVFPIRAIAHGFFRRPSVLVATTNPFYLPLVLIATRPLHRVPVVALVYDVYPDALEVSGVATPTGLLARAATGANRFWLSRAEAVVFIGPEMAEHVRGRYGSPPYWEVIETGASVSEFDTGCAHAADAESELERWCRGKVVVSYVGNMGQMHDWETVCRAVPRVLADPALARLCFVVAASGAGAEYPGQAVVRSRPGSGPLRASAARSGVGAIAVVLQHRAGDLEGSGKQDLDSVQDLQRHGGRQRGGRGGACGVGPRRRGREGALRRGGVSGGCGWPGARAPGSGLRSGGAAPGAGSRSGRRRGAL